LSSTPAHGRCIAGIFIGGQSSRMLGTPKGLLRPPASHLCLVERLVQELAAANLHEVVLVGAHQAYAALGLPIVLDSPVGRGPLAGLLGLVEHAQQHHTEFVLALACDMPKVDAALLRRLLESEADADAWVPRRARWEPLCARYRVAAVQSHLRRLLSTGQYRMTSLLQALGPRCVELALDRAGHDALADWDSPSDLPAGVSYLGRSWPGRGA